MPKQPAIPGLRNAMKKKVTRREQFLAEMDAVVPWMRLQALIELQYPKAGLKGGRPPMPLETMLRIYFLQNWYALSDPMAEETLYDSEACAGSLGSNWAMTAFRTRPRSSTSGICWSVTG